MNKIAILLPYKEKYTLKKAGAASIWVNDYLRQSKLFNLTTIFGNLSKNESPLSKNFINIDIKNLFYKKNVKYTEIFYKYLLKSDFKIVEIHNRPESLVYLIKKKINIKKIFFYHNNPLELRDSKTVEERKFILENTDQIYFVSNWVKKKFFQGLDIDDKNNCNVMYPAIKPISKFPKKEKIIIFTGKLNSAKGYDIFGKAIINILNKFPDWKAYSIGNEPREKIFFYHKRFKSIDWLPHNKILAFYKKSSISIVPSKWEEPFGRTAMESAAYGCATLISNRGGLTETFYDPIKIDPLNVENLEKSISKLINNKKLLIKIQKRNLYNVKNDIKFLVATLDQLKESLLINKFNYIYKDSCKILHIANFDQKTNHRLFNLSVAHKISNGLIRNGNDVINFSYRDYLNKTFLKKFANIDEKIIDICDNYKPNLILLGHNNVLQRKTLSQIKMSGAKISIWYEDHVAESGPNYLKNLRLIEKNNDLIDKYFITTHPDVVKTKIPKKKLNFLPIPADENIENLKIYNIKSRYKDLFFALSHGVNFGNLRRNNNDERNEFIMNLLKRNDRINCNILGLNNEQPKWNYDYYNEMIKCKMALNLSRGNPLKYASSNRISTLVANGILTFIDKKTKYEDFFDNNEMCFYNNISDLENQIDNLKGNMNKINLISKKGKKRYFEIFNNYIISDFIVSESLEIKNKYKFIWK